MCNLLAERRFVRSLGLGGDPGQVPALSILPVDQGGVLRNPVVPDDNGARLPPNSRVEVGAERDVLIQELENGIRLFLLEPNNITSDCITDTASLFPFTVMAWT